MVYYLLAKYQKYLIESDLFIDSSLFYLSNNIVFIPLISILIFLIFVQIKLRNSNLLNFISSCTVGIYLIHDNIIFKQILWGQIFILKDHIVYTDFIKWGILSPLVVYCLLVAVESIRKICILFLNKFTNKIFKKIDDFYYLLYKS